MGSFSVRKYLRPAIGIALLCGFLQALPFIGISPRPPALASAARGILASRGFAPASPWDHLHAWLWQLGGSPALVAGLAVEQFFIWTLIAAFVLFSALAIFRFVPWPRLRVCFVAILLLCLAGGFLINLWSAFSAREALTRSPLLFAPVELAAATSSLPPGSVFANPSAIPHLLLFSPASLGVSDSRIAARLSSSPSAWREELRKSSWSAALLSGPAAEIQPLLDHLLSSPDWRLASVSNQGYLFLRSHGPSASPIDLAKFSLSDDASTAIYLAQIAERYEALRKTAAAKACISRALDLAPRNPEVLIHAASLEAGRRHWQDVLTFSDRALRSDPSASYARLLKALALLETGRPDNAATEAATVLSSSPNDPYTLFLYARISRTRHDYHAEAATLEKLISVTRASGAPVPAGYFVFLGQAYAKTGNAPLALRAYRSALAQPDLGPALSSEVSEAIQTIESRKNF